MKINSKAPSVFKIMGTPIYPGVHNYRNIDPRDRAVRFQLVVLKNDGIVDFHEELSFDLKELPFQKEKVAVKVEVVKPEVVEPEVVVEPAPAPYKKSKYKKRASE